MNKPIDLIVDYKDGAGQGVQGVGRTHRRYSRGKRLISPPRGMAEAAKTGFLNTTRSYTCIKYSQNEKAAQKKTAPSLERPPDGLSIAEERGGGQ